MSIEELLAVASPQARAVIVAGLATFTLATISALIYMGRFFTRNFHKRDTQEPYDI